MRVPTLFLQHPCNIVDVVDEKTRRKKMMMKMMKIKKIIICLL